MNNIKNRFSFIALALLVSVGFFTGCVREYNTPKFEEIAANETAFVVPLQGNTSNQAKFDSVKFLETAKVAAKRIQIPREFVQTGRWSNDGEYKDTVKVVKVDRTPVTAEFAVSDAKAAKKDADAIWLESADSVGFSTGFSVTANILEEDTALFLYKYPASSLRGVMSTEIRARIQSISSAVASKYKLDDLRAKKQEMVDAVKADIVPFFKDRGINITTVGMFGGMTYENPQIQQAIDTTFVNQQEKVNAAALYAAQDDKNKVVTSAADAAAEATRRKAKGDADAAKIKADGDAAALLAINAAAEKAAANPLLYQLKALEVERARVEKWNGAYPGFMMSGGAQSPGLLLNIPAK